MHKISTQWFLFFERPPQNDQPWTGWRSYTWWCGRLHHLPGWSRSRTLFLGNDDYDDDDTDDHNHHHRHHHQNHSQISTYCAHSSRCSWCSLQIHDLNVITLKDFPYSSPQCAVLSERNVFVNFLLPWLWWLITNLTDVICYCSRDDGVAWVKKRMCI